MNPRSVLFGIWMSSGNGIDEEESEMRRILCVTGMAVLVGWFMPAQAWAGDGCHALVGNLEYEPGFKCYDVVCTVQLSYQDKTASGTSKDPHNSSEEERIQGELKGRALRQATTAACSKICRNDRECNYDCRRNAIVESDCKKSVWVIEENSSIRRIGIEQIGSVPSDIGI